MDHVSKAKRSEMMRAVRGRDTEPELALRRVLHRAGYRYTLHDKKLPGTPDIVFPARRKVIFVNGCFWHGHPGCPKARLPRTRVAFWKRKVELNRSRDAVRIRELRSLGWKVLVIWQCQLKRLDRAFARANAFLQES